MYLPVVEDELRSNGATSSNWLPDFLWPIIWFCVILSVYSTIINTIFGHKSYWKLNLNYFLPKNFAKPSQIQQQRQLLRRGQSNGILVLPDCVLLHIASYLNGYDILSLSSTSKLLYSLCSEDYLWKEIAAISFHPQYYQVVSSQWNKLKYFQSIKVYPLILMRALKNTDVERKYVIIRRAVYDITEFIDIHPGGSHILMDVEGMDGTFKFNIALHSKTAKKMMRQYLIWSPKLLFSVDSSAAVERFHST